MVTVEVFSTHPIWFSAFFSTLASPCLRLSSQLNFQTLRVWASWRIWSYEFWIWGIHSPGCLQSWFGLVRFGSLRLRSWFALVRSWFAQKAKKIRFFEGLRNPGSFWFAFGSLRLRSWFALVRSWFAAVPLRFRS